MARTITYTTHGRAVECIVAQINSNVRFCVELLSIILGWSAALFALVRHWFQRVAVGCLIVSMTVYSITYCITFLSGVAKFCVALLVEWLVQSIHAAFARWLGNPFNVAVKV